MTVALNPIVLPPSNSTVSVKIFNAFRSLSIPSGLFLTPAPESTSDEASNLVCPGKSFLLEHRDGRKVVFDLGIRKDVSTMAKHYRENVESGKFVIDFGPDVAETLVAGGVSLESISAVIWRSVPPYMLG
jgi:hypothetical protein